MTYRLRPPHHSPRQAFGVTLEEFNAISQAKSKLDFRPGEECLYRGQPNKNVAPAALTPTALRSEWAGRGQGLNLRREAFLKRLAKQGLTPAGYPQSPLDEMEEREKEERNVGDAVHFISSFPAAHKHAHR